MPAYQPTADQFRAFRDDPHDGPIAQVNLLKFRVKAEYAADHPLHGVDEPGSAAYGRYVDAFGVAAAEVGGTCLLYSTTERYFIGRGDWDAVLVMHFPTGQRSSRRSTIPTTRRCISTVTPACCVRN